MGVILLLSCVIDGKARVNLSSWYVDPPYRMHASMLVFFALKRQDVTYLNISPARHTWPTIEAQGFRRYTSGQFIGLPALRRSRGRAIVHRLDPGLVDDPRPRGAARAGYRSRPSPHGLALPPGRGLRRPSSLRVRAVSASAPARCGCRPASSSSAADIGDYLRFAGLIGRHLLRDGVIFVVHDANAPEPGMLGYFRDPMAPKYSRGPHEPRRGDLAYTERVIFGP